MNAQRQSDSEQDQGRQALLRYGGMGFELAASIIGLTLFGLWIDYQFHISPTGVVIGAGLGTVGGLYNFIRSALRLSRQDNAPKQHHETHNNDELDESE